MERQILQGADNINAFTPYLVFALFSLKCEHNILFNKNKSIINRTPQLLTNIPYFVCINMKTTYYYSWPYSDFVYLQCVHET